MASRIFVRRTYYIKVISPAIIGTQGSISSGGTPKAPVLSSSVTTSDSPSLSRKAKLSLAFQAFNNNADPFSVNAPD